MNKLETKSCEEIMTTVYMPLEFVVDGLIAKVCQSIFRNRGRNFRCESQNEDKSLDIKFEMNGDFNNTSIELEKQLETA